jgi:hypothetical protein
MLGRHARPCESFLVCIEDSGLFFMIGRTSTHLENLSMATSRWV